MHVPASFVYRLTRHHTATALRRGPHIHAPTIIPPRNSPFASADRSVSLRSCVRHLPTHCLTSSINFAHRASIHKHISHPATNLRPCSLEHLTPNNGDRRCRAREQSSTYSSTTLSSRRAKPPRPIFDTCAVAAVETRACIVVEEV